MQTSGEVCFIRVLVHFHNMNILKMNKTSWTYCIFKKNLFLFHWWLISVINLYINFFLDLARKPQMTGLITNWRVRFLLVSLFYSFIFFTYSLSIFFFFLFHPYNFLTLGLWKTTHITNLRMRLDLCLFFSYSLNFLSVLFFYSYNFFSYVKPQMTGSDHKLNIEREDQLGTDLPAIVLK